ncbi:MBL fold metallo-hydrolase [Clostridium saccharoperbutylacetonicum]
MKFYKLCVIRTQKNNFINYSYIVFDKETKEAVIIDPSWELNKINRVIKDYNLDLKWILLTHSHDDHINLVIPLILQYNVQVYMSEIESSFYKYSCHNLNTVKDREKLLLGDMIFDCILTPGHTVGSMCFFMDDIIFTGDTLFIEGCGTCNTIGGNAEDMFESIQRLKKIVSQSVKVYPAHSFGMALGKSMGTLYDVNIYLNFQDKFDFVKFRERSISNSYEFK